VARRGAHLSRKSAQTALDHFVGNGLTEAQARQALAYRDLCSANIYLDGFTPIVKGT
jgi:hypothetical protein